MDINHFQLKIPFVYHLTDVNNLDNIVNTRLLLSTKEIFTNVGLSLYDIRLYTRRKNHLVISNEKAYHIRDQRPLTRALKNCLIGGCTEEEFTFLLNSRVFFWPNMKRLQVHFERYKLEKPKIIKVQTSSLILLNNDRIEITNINSGATRCSGTLGGKAAPRGKNTFQKIVDYNKPASTVAEFTIHSYCNLPDDIYVSDNPEGPWNKV